MVILDHRLAEAGRARRGYRVTDRVEAADRAAAEMVATDQAAMARAEVRAATVPAAAADMVPEAMAAARVAPAMILATSTRLGESVSNRGSAND